MSDQNKYLIREYFELCEGGRCQDFLTEQEKKRVAEDGVIFLTGKLQEAEVQNGNGRVYPRPILEVLNTPSGNILKSLVESGVKMGISSRALGSVSQRAGKTIVEEDLQLICFDMVSEPSAPNAFMLKEHREHPEKQDKLNQLLDSIIKK